MSKEVIKSDVRRVFDEAFNKGNLAAQEEMFATDMADHNITGADSQIDMEGFKQRIGGHRAGVPHLHFALEDISLDDDRVSFRWTMSGTNLGPFPGRPATGKPVTITAMNME
jgi:predicted ester cyclase